MEFNKLIKSRKSVRKFKDKKPDWRDIIECIDYARYIPIAGNDYTSKFILIDDKEKIRKISKSAQQDFISQAHYLVAVCSTTSRITKSFKERGEIYLRQQSGAAIQNFLLAIEEKGLSTCWIGHFVDEQIKKELKIPDNVNIEAIFPIGYELKKEKPKRKIDLDRILYFKQYGTKKMKSLKKVEGMSFQKINSFEKSDV
jgi:nitroreductase|tara:strand:+ start:7081 stop:7677 length:597 start_codon:yes stop_codon:yes gene_type:complete